MELKSFDTQLWENGIELVIKDLEGKELSEVTNQDDFLELLIALIVEFKGLKENGKEVKFSKEKCLEILKAYPFITSQIDVAVGNSKLFLQK